jgi:prolipoprotein diacylglyceryltransferase
VEYFHPLFAYESILSLANMFFLMWIARRYTGRLKPGDVLLAYLITYPVIRFSLDFLRLDASRVAGVNANQTVAAVVAVVATGALFWHHRATESESQASASIRRSYVGKAGVVARKSPARKKPVSKKAAKKTTPRKSSAKKKTA